MKFDVIVGNPPYTNDVYLDFITLGHLNSKLYTSMITPAKWQTKDNDKSIGFRQSISKFMREIVYFPDCIQIFGISESPGVAYFLMDKEVHTEKVITNKSNFQSLINSVVSRKLEEGDTLWNVGVSIVDKIKDRGQFKSFEIHKLNNHERKKYTVCVGKQWCGSRLSSGAWDMSTSKIKESFIGKGGCVFNPDGTVKVLGKTIILDENTQDSSNSSICIFTSDSLDEAKSFYSYINTKLFSFLILINLSVPAIFNNQTLKYIPNPVSFDHLYTDDELYTKYGLSVAEINIIESTIRRKR